jgi:hypothetical protein
MDVRMSLESVILELQERIDLLKVGAMAAEGAIANPDLDRHKEKNTQVLNEIRAALAGVESSANRLKAECCQQQTCNFRILDQP